ncbi:MAG: hypothetical protein QOI38_155 [Sphingomonadales bacterium]|nr:hypothetical protein [Sphingomonadales bacterium]
MLVHGFAVNEQDARQRFADFRSHLPAPYRSETAEVLWPGDMRGATIHSVETGGVGGRIASVLAYPFQLSRAKASARRLMRRMRDELDQRAKLVAAGSPFRPLELSVVAHSLGCLVVLELLKALEARPKYEMRLSVIALMAAAVPQYRLRDDDFGSRLAEARRLLVYYSEADKVLAVAFGPGQSLQWRFPQGLRNRAAVGLVGCGRPFRNAIEQRGNRGHGDYWNDEKITRDVAAALEETRPLLLRRAMSPGRACPVRKMDGFR